MKFERCVKWGAGALLVAVAIGSIITPQTLAIAGIGIWLVVGLGTAHLRYTEDI